MCTCMARLTYRMVRAHSQQRPFPARAIGICFCNRGQTMWILRITRSKHWVKSSMWQNCFEPRITGPAGCACSSLWHDQYMTVTMTHEFLCMLHDLNTVTANYQGLQDLPKPASCKLCPNEKKTRWNMYSKVNFHSNLLWITKAMTSLCFFVQFVTICMNHDQIVNICSNHMNLMKKHNTAMNYA